METDRLFLKSITGLILVLLTVDVAHLPAQELPRPTDRWRADKTGSFTGGLDLPVPIVNALPQLSDQGIKSGQAKLTLSKDGKSLVVDQESAKLLAYWKNYNIGQTNRVDYQQPSSESVAVNIIQQQSPSQILGKLSCDGACWLVNPNGIIFGDNAQVDSHGLIAAAMEFNGLPMDGNPSAAQLETFANDSLFNAINNGEAFLVNAKDLAAGTDELPRIVVQEGAEITSDSAPVLLAGPEVINEGSVSSDGGQVVLAGSRKDVYLALTNPNNDKDYRGYLIEVDSGDRPDGARGAVVNAGELVANLGNVTLVASEIVQAGRIKSTTAVDVNGAVRLLARDRAEIRNTASQLTNTSTANLDALYIDNSNQAPLTEFFAVGTEAGDVSLRSGSSIEIAIDGSDKTATDDLVQRRSQVNIEGRYVSMEEESSIVAPAGELTVRARVNPVGLLSDIEADSDASFAMKGGAKIDVSGTENTLLPVARNMVEFFITSNELKDAPQQKGGSLLRQTISVDIRRGTPLFDWTTGLEGIGKTASERAASGGSINIASKGNLSIANNAVLDVSGGMVNYEAGFVESSRILGRNGLIDISEANPDDAYFQVLGSELQELNDPKWKQITSFRPGPSRSRYFREAYFEGGDAGSITLSGARQQIGNKARLSAGASLGRFQLEGREVPVGGNISFLFPGGAVQQTVAIVDEAQTIANQLTENLTELSVELLEESGAGQISINNQGGLIKQLDTAGLTFNRGTSLALTAGGIALDGDIRTAGGNVVVSQTADLPAIADDSGQGVLSVAGVIDTSGNWTNFSPGLDVKRGFMPFVDAGNITLRANGRLDIQETAAFVANAGASVTADGEVNIGDAGNITLSVKRNDGQVGQLNVAGPLNVSALDGGDGGLLTFEVGDVLIGDFGESQLTEELRIDNSFFDETLVGGYKFVAIDGNVDVLDSADIDLAHDSLLPVEYAASVPGADDIGEALTLPGFIPPALNLKSNANQLPANGSVPVYQAAPGELILEARRTDATNSDKGILALHAGSVITGPTYSTVDLFANTRMLIDGKISIAGGRLDAYLTQIDTENSNQGNYILVGDNADIDLSAAIVDLPTDSLTTKSLLIDAGSVALNSLFGSVWINQGAGIDLAGAVARSRQYVYSELNPGGALMDIERPIAAGDFSVVSEKGIHMAATLDFGDSSSGFVGGRQSYRLAQRNSVFRGSNELSWREPASLSPAPFLEFSLSDNMVEEAGLAFGDDIDGGLIGVGSIAGANLNAIHTARLSLDVDNSYFGNNLLAANAIRVADDTHLKASESVVLDTANLSLDEGVHFGIEAPHVQIGETRDNNSLFQEYSAPVAGDAAMVVEAALVDLYGNLGISGLQELTLNADTGVRTRSVTEGVDDVLRPREGVLSTTGNLVINSPMLWAESLARYQFDLSGEDSLFSMAATGKPAPAILSAGSELTINANRVEVDSKIAAPLGSITINGDEKVFLGSRGELSVAGEGDVPLGRVIADGVSWLYQIGQFVSGRGPIAIDRLPEKRVDISADEVVSEPGSVVNLSGGGTVVGREFVKGLGGSTDFLANRQYTEMFAVLPGHLTSFAPFDLKEFDGSNIPWGTFVEIAGSDQIADGKYTVLPANYALLPGAFLVTPEQAVSANVGRGYQGFNRFGAEVVSGYFGSQDGGVTPQWSTFRVEPGSVIANRADYRLTDADTFITPGLPGTRPEENGRLVLNVSDTLSFAGRVSSSAASPVGVGFDLLTDGDIVFGSMLVAGSLRVNPDILDGLGADSVLIGGSREWLEEEGAWQLTPVASTVTFDNAALATQELVVTAKDLITLKNQSLIDSTASPVFMGSRWKPTDDGVTLLSSTAVGSVLDLDDVAAPDGGLLIENGSAVVSGGTLGIAYDGVNSLARLNFDDSADGTRFQVATDNLGIGDTSLGAIVDNALFQAATFTELKAGSRISFNKDINTFLEELKIQTPEIILEDGVNVAVAVAGDTSLIATSSAEITPVKSTGSSLELRTDRLLVSSLDPDNIQATNYLGFNASSLSVEADRDIVTSGAVSLVAAGDMHLSTPLIGASGVSRFSGKSAGNLVIDNGGAKLNREVVGGYSPGAAYYFSAEKDLSINTAVSALSGQIDLGAVTGSLTIGQNAMLDVSPYSVTFPDRIRTAPAGIISATAANNLKVDPGSLIFGSGSQSGIGGGLELLAGGELTFTQAANGLAGKWSSGGVDLRVQADSVADDLQSLLFLNGQGFDGAVDILLTGVGENLSLGGADSLVADDLRLATSGGTLNINGSVTVNDATQAVSFFGGNGVNFGDTAQLTVRSGSKRDTELESDNGAVVVDAGSHFNLAGGLKVIKSRFDNLTSVIVDGSDSIMGDISLLISESFERNTFNQTEFDNLAGNLAAFAGTVNGTDYIAGQTVNVQPLLDIYSTTGLTVSAMDLTNTGHVGELRLRAVGDISINGKINAATKSFSFASFGSTQILLPDDSWSLALAAGAADSASQYLYAEGIQSAGSDITLANNSYLQTGTGDLNLLATGDLILLGDSYLATLGKTEYLTDDLFFAGQDRPAWGDQTYSKMYSVLQDFSGFSRDSGDINIRVNGGISGQGVPQTPASFVQRLTVDDLELTTGNIYKDYRTWTLAVDRIKRGIHSVGGGAVSVDAGGDIVNMGFTTPGLALGYTQDRQFESLPGGDLDVVSRGDILHSSFANDGANLDVRAFGNIGGKASQPGASLFMVSHSHVSAMAGAGLAYDAVVNPFSIPYSSTQRRLPIVKNSGSLRTASTFFYGFGETELDLLAIAGDIRRTMSRDSVLSFLPQTEFSSLYTGNEGRFLILPSRVEQMALDGNIVLASESGGDNFALFPSARTRLTLAAKGSVYSDLESKIRIPDLTADVIPSIDDTYEKFQDSALAIATADLIEQPLNESRNDTLINRDPNDLLGLYTIDGDIGNDTAKLRFEVPIAVDAYAGNDLKNVTFNIQHSKPGTISKLFARNDVIFPLTRREGGVGLERGNERGIKVAGPGDLIVSAGRDVRLGTTNFGIESVGNLENPALPEQGANVHVFAGHSRKGDYKALIGSGVSGYESIAVPGQLGLDQSSLENLSITGWFDSYGKHVADADHILSMINSIARATGQAYVQLETGMQWQDISLSQKTAFLNAALADWEKLSPSTQLRIAVTGMKDIALISPDIFVEKGDILFANPALGVAGFTSAEQRREAFESYWSAIGSLITLEYLLTPNREAELIDSLELTKGELVHAISGLPVENKLRNYLSFVDKLGLELDKVALESLINDVKMVSVQDGEQLSDFLDELKFESFTDKSIASQINSAVTVFESYDPTRQMLAAENVMLEHIKQSGREGVNAGNALINFERSYVAQRMFFGGDFDPTIAGIRNKANQILNAQIAEPENVTLGVRDGLALSSIDDVLKAWEEGTGQNFTGDYLPENRGDVSLRFSTIKTSSGGDINLLAPSGSVDVGLAASQLEALDIRKTQEQQGVIALGLGDVNGIVADAYNVNESRSFSLAGGDMSLWSSFGDIDAGKGAKTTVVTPETSFQISLQNGRITSIRPPAVSGSGIRTSASRSSTGGELTPEERFYELAEGAGAIFLSTPLGIVDAGEAGIESAGDLFIAAAEVRGADNINVAGVSLGVATDTTVSASVGNLGDAANAATESAQSSATRSATGAGSEGAPAFVTIELIGTGT